MGLGEPDTIFGTIGRASFAIGWQWDSAPQEAVTATDKGTGMTQLTQDDRIHQELKEHPAKKGLVFNVAVSVLEIGGAIVLFRVAKNNGAGNVAAYLIGSLAPVLGALLVWVRSKKFSGASAAIFAFAVLSAAVAVIGSTDEKVLLYKDCATTAVIGLIFALSCVLMPRPVIFYFAQRYGTDGSKEGMNAFDEMWVAYAGFRRSMYKISLVWAFVFLIQAAVTAVIIAAEPFSVAYNWDQILPVVAFVLAMAITFSISRRARAEGAARQAAAAR